jgi:hypothetical protein
MRRVIVAAFLTVAAGVWLIEGRAADEDKPKFTVKEVMKLHKDKLNEKYQNGNATEEEKKKLLEGYEALVKNKPPKGDAAAWKTKTEALVKAIKDDDKDAYKKAVNCAGCHSAHKPQ